MLRHRKALVFAQALVSPRPSSASARAQAPLGKHSVLCVQESAEAAPQRVDAKDG